MGVWDSILPGGGRRFIKRKDSDAGEAGRALEELRGSLYNDFHTSDGAKRQQQRFCGPIVALTFNFVVAVGIIMANKMVMGTVGFNFPVALSLIHYLFALVLMAVLKALYLLPIAPPSKSTPFSSLFALGAVMSFSTGLANISLKHNSVGFYQMAKIAVTPTIVVAEFILFQKKVSVRKWSGALALGATSALAHVVLGQFKTIVIMLSGYLVFNSDPGFTSLCGAVIALAGMSVYTYLGMKESATNGRRNSLNSRQNSHLLKSKVIIDGEKQETRTVDSV
uniref:Sugar phosphate transporter domain-containing protein n=1 Tax=Setaria italica TaxID=4555 RepID=K3XYP6_SETIT